MESPNAVAWNKAMSDVSSKSGEDMDHPLVVGEAMSNVSSKNSEEKVGLSAVPGGSNMQGAKDCNELNPEVKSLSSNNQIPPVVLETSRDSPKGVDLDESSLEVNSLKAKDENPEIVIDPIDESSKGENLEELNLEVNSPHTNTGEIPPVVQDPLQDSAKEKNLDESDVEVPSVEPEASDVENADQDDGEYACKYCHRKFTNKQSLGGHQNAHKFERALEKDVSEFRQLRAGYFSGTSSYPRMTSPLSSHPGSLKRSYEYMNRPLQISRPYRSEQILQHQGMQVARPVMPNMLPQTIPHNFHEFYHGYHHGWSVPVPRISTAVPTVPVPRVSQFVTSQTSYLPSLALTLQFPNPGASSSTSSSRPISQGLPAFPESRSVPGRNAGVQNNNQRNAPGNEEDDSGLDLTLRL